MSHTLLNSAHLHPLFGKAQRQCTGATYDSIEGRFRIVRREAKLLKEEIDNGTRASAPPRGGSTATSFASDTVTKPPRAKKAATGDAKPKKERVLGGRVTKSGVSSKSTKVLGDAFEVNGMMENGMKEMKQEGSSSQEGFYDGSADEMMGGVAHDGYVWAMDSV